MDFKKTVTFSYASQVVKPKWRDLAAGNGVAEIEAAEFRVRNALAGNSHAINLIFDTIAKQAQLGNNIFGPFIFAGASGTGKTTLVKALVSKTCRVRQPPRRFAR
jgi:ATP-dependent Clp protease ATP-binding subunit ClpA